MHSMRIYNPKYNQRYKSIQTTTTPSYLLITAIKAAGFIFLLYWGITLSLEYRHQFSIATDPSSINTNTMLSSSQNQRVKNVLNENISEIKYSLVEDEDMKYKRFAAYYKSKNGHNNVHDQTWIPLSIQTWAEQLLRSNSITDSSSTDNHDNIFIQQFQDTILDATAHYKAFFFETKGASRYNVSTKQFEFVLVNAPKLYEFCDRNGPDVYAFSEHFHNQCRRQDEQRYNQNELDGKSDIDTISTSSSCTFPNLGRDAILVAPMNIKNNEDTNFMYSHLASFLRNGTFSEIEQFWNLVLKVYLEQFVKDATAPDSFLKDGQSMWLSTSGMGISWLHMRMDLKPKYYTYQPFTLEY